MTSLLERPARATEKPPTSYRPTAILVGLFFIVGTVAGVLSGVVTNDALTADNVLAAAGADPNALVLGGMLVLVMGLPLAMIPVLMYPLFRHHSRVLAMGAIVFRGVLEAVAYVLLALAMFLTATMGRALAAGSGDVIGWQSALLGAMDWVEVILAIVFSLGAMMLGWLFYRTELIPRWLALWGLIGGVLYFVAPWIVMFNIADLEISLTTSIGWLLAPLAVQEMVFAVWVLVRGFRSEAVARLVSG